MVDANMFEHADGDNPVKWFFNMPVVLELKLNAAIQAKGLCPLNRKIILLL